MLRRMIPVWFLILVILLAANVTVMFGALVLYLSQHQGEKKFGKWGTVALTIAEYPWLLKRAFYELTSFTPQLVENRFPSLNGFKKNGVVPAGVLNDKGFLLLSVYDGSKKKSTVKLIRISDQRVLHEWSPDVQRIAELHNEADKSFNKDSLTPDFFRMLYPLLQGNGSIVFGDAGPIYTIDICSNPQSVIKGFFHHAREQDAEGNFWTPSVVDVSTYDPSIYRNYQDDAIAKISPAGDVLFKKSVSRILEENGYRGLLFGVGNYESDMIHLNDVQPALYSTKYWEKGDLLLSARNLSTVFIYRPSTNKIIWLKTGPWMKQHDASFVGQSQVSIFGNDVIGNFHPNGHNEMYIYDFADGSVSAPYSDVLKKLDVRTNTEGRLKILSNGDAFIEESNYGRILRISPKQLEWEFVSKENDNRVGLLSWSRYMTSEEVSNLLPMLEKANCSPVDDREGK